MTTATPPRRTPLTVAVIGGGFSGLLTAIHLLRADPEVIVRLVERGAHIGRGRAYGTENPDHLLNVRVANMSAFPDQPDHFAAWLRARNVGKDLAAGEDLEACRGPNAFVSRSLFGDYLQGLLREHLGDPGNAGRLLLESDEAVDVLHTADRHLVKLALGRGFEADAVVLATGALPPASPPGADDSLLSSPGYFADPWTIDRSAVPAGDILVIGCGLTMIDTALSLAGDGRRLTALSRHGLLPRSHAPTRPAAAPMGPMDTPRAALRTLRRHARAVGWREAIDSIRPQTTAIWQAWPLAERRRFQRHAQSFWDAHRHRMAPAVAEIVDGQMERGDLEIVGGRIEALRAQDGGVEVTYRRRCDGHLLFRRFAAVINCTGPRGRVGPDTPGVLGRLAAAGAVRAEPQGLGLDVGVQGQAFGAGGAPTPGLFAVGPLTQGAFWEAVAVPDLRNHTERVAAAVLATLGR
jgi:uncharacterized NAD(P)/FAD-binding protein YdhS